MFVGAIPVTFDTKGRFSMPTKHRAALLLDETAPLAITKNPDGYLMLFPKARWDEVMLQMAQWSDDAATWRSYFMSNYVDLEMDAAGRVSIPAWLRESVSIGGGGVKGDTATHRDAMLIGVGNYFELWDTETRRALDRNLERIPRGERPPEVRGFQF
jgi:MraZ protein